MSTKSRFVRRKNVRKALRSALEILLLAWVTWSLLGATVLRERYQPAPASAYTQRDGGFIALSYFGVSHTGTDTLISQSRLDAHLGALHAAGYVTVSQQDLLSYYHNGGSLPPRALFLFFEDGRRESAVLAQDILQKYNYQASMLSYANNLQGWDQLFLSADDLKALKRSTFWELGTNGYRLSYINVFDRHDNYLGEMTPVEFFQLRTFIHRNYNHYLMDFLRDRYDIPMESKEQMQRRVAADYALMRSVYQDRLGAVPALYALMHANTGQFATNDIVSAENEAQIGQYFLLNFNREMFAHNDLACDGYDLTRMQPQAYWPVNHLITRLRDDTGADLPFACGDADTAARWTLLKGVAEFQGSTIYLTSPSREEGRLLLQGSGGLMEYTLSVRLMGGKLGVQAVDLLHDEAGSAHTAVEINDNELLVYTADQAGEVDSLLFSLDLDVHDGVVYQTLEENRREAMHAAIAVKQAQTYQAAQSQAIAGELALNLRIPAGTSREPYVPEISIHELGDRRLRLHLRGNALSVWIDGRPAVLDLALPTAPGGPIGLRSGWEQYGYSQRNIADDVYDGVFEGLTIHAPGRPGAEMLYGPQSTPPHPLAGQAQNLLSRVRAWAGGLLINQREVS